MARIAAVTPQDLELEAPLMHAISSGDHVYGFTSISNATKSMVSTMGNRPMAAEANAANATQPPLTSFSKVIAENQKQGGGGGGAAGSVASSKKSAKSATANKPPAALVNEHAKALEESMHYLVLGDRNRDAGGGGEGSSSSSSSSSSRSSNGFEGGGDHSPDFKTGSQAKGKTASEGATGGASAENGTGTTASDTVVLPGAPTTIAPLTSAANGKRRASLSLNQIVVDDAGDNEDGPNAILRSGVADTLEGQVGKNIPIPTHAMQTNKAIFEKAITDRNKREVEGRTREQQCYSDMNDPVALQQARSDESANPLFLSNILRSLIFFQGQQLVEENNVQPGGHKSNPYSNFDSHTNKSIRASMQLMAHSNDQLRKGMPLLRGSFAETVVVGVYQHYTNDSGFMSLETFVRFMSDCGFVNTHCPHSEFDEPTLDVAEKLDPIRLLTTIPKSSVTGIHDPNENIASAALQEALKEDQFTINFTQWYSILLKISQIVYPTVYSQSASEALNKILLESILPLYIWCSQGHSKLGTTDPLVADERIALLFMTYAPNLWKVFLSYACDSTSKAPAITLSYPNHAQAAEAALFGVPPACPYVPPNKLHITHTANIITTRQTTSNNLNARSELLGNNAKERRMSRVTLCSSVKKGTSQYKSGDGMDRSISSETSSTFGGTFGGGSTLSGTQFGSSQTKQQIAAAAAATYGLVITERRLMQLCSDFGITNDLVPKNVLSALFKLLNKSKKLTLTRIATKVDAHIAAKDTKAMLTTSQKLKSRRASVAQSIDAMYKKSTEPGLPVDHLAKTAAGSPKKPVLSSDSRSAKVQTGLAFSEFLEFLGHVALHGMELEHFHTLFPNPFSKVLALLTVWGVADTSKLQEVLLLHVDIVL